MESFLPMPRCFVFVVYALLHIKNLSKRESSDVLLPFS